jgi:hypothetical protein
MILEELPSRLGRSLPDIITSRSGSIDQFVSTSLFVHMFDLRLNSIRRCLIFGNRHSVTRCTFVQADSWTFLDRSQRGASLRRARPFWSKHQLLEWMIKHLGIKIFTRLQKKVQVIVKIFLKKQARPDKSDI